MSNGNQSNDLIEFVTSVVSNIVAELAVIFLVAAVAFVSRSGIRRLIRAARYAWRMNKNGVINFYNSRAEYFTSRPERTLPEYMARAKHRLLYVGFSLAGATERDRIDDAITDMLNRGCEVEIVMLDPDAPLGTIKAVEQHLAIADGTLGNVLRHARDHFLKLRNELSAAAASRFKIKVHAVPLVSSAMLIDEGETDGRLLVDNKIHGAGRDRSFGIEFRLDQNADGLARDFAQSFKRVAASAH
jgi:hypothetical protein